MECLGDDLEHGALGARNGSFDGQNALLSVDSDDFQPADGDLLGAVAPGATAGVGAACSNSASIGSSAPATTALFKSPRREMRIAPPLIRRAFSPSELGRAVGYFPLVGAALGLLLAGAAWALARVFPAGVSAALVLALLLVIAFLVSAGTGVRLRPGMVLAMTFSSFRLSPMRARWKAASPEGAWWPLASSLHSKRGMVMTPSGPRRARRARAPA